MSGREITRISAFPKKEIRSDSEFSPASAQMSAVIWTTKAILRAFKSIGMYWKTTEFLVISVINVITGKKTLKDKTKIEIVIKILTNREYSAFIFLKTMHMTKAHKTIPHTFISFIKSQTPV